MKSKLTFLLALTFLFLFSCSEKEPKPKIKTTKQEKLNETTFSKRDVALQGLIHTFSDSGKLLKSITYHEGIILSQKEYLDPPSVNSLLIKGVSQSNYYHNELPDYGKLMNKKWTTSEKKEFLNIFKNLKFTESNPCDISLKGTHVSLKDNQCNQSESDSLGSFIKAKAPWIDISHLAYSKKRINGRPTLFVFMSSIDKEDHPYMVIYQFTFPLDDIFIQFYGPFLNGDYHGINKVNGNDTLFIKYESCMECHPWVYLQAIQFFSELPASISLKNIGVPLHFNYSFGEPSWSPRMEYELPGMGHSVEGSVETRIARTGPFSIIQKFTLSDGPKTEWWGFNCASFRCKTNLRKGDLPKDWIKGWRTGESMGLREEKAKELAKNWQLTN
tara:strand:+ start:488 stop:1648 length:1161 start_codon:yes stop_codon:yes gene_type:complete